MYGTETTRLLDLFKADLQQALMKLLESGDAIPATTPDGFDRLLGMVRDRVEAMSDEQLAAIGFQKQARLGVRIGVDTRTEE